jgi:3-phenylpropionate/cinnamic acid dioxygenase small subunit
MGTADAGRVIGMTLERELVESFLYREARLMDAHRYDEWLALFDEDATYWIPSNRDDVDPRREVSIAYANREHLTLQVQRLASGRAYTQDPPARLCRVVSNVEIEPADGDEAVVRSVFHLQIVRAGRDRVIAGRVIHRLRCRDGGLRIVSKKIELAANDEVLGDLTFLL